jgi:hypothetical protein
VAIDKTIDITVGDARKKATVTVSEINLWSR